MVIFRSKIRKMEILLVDSEIRVTGVIWVIFAVMLGFDNFFLRVY
jgi:hypothetical protein